MSTLPFLSRTCHQRTILCCFTVNSFCPFHNHILSFSFYIIALYTAARHLPPAVTTRSPTIATTAAATALFHHHMVASSSPPSFPL